MDFLMTWSFTPNSQFLGRQHELYGIFNTWKKAPSWAGAIIWNSVSKGKTYCFAI